MFLLRFDALRSLSEYTSTDKWNLRVIYIVLLLSLTHSGIRASTL